MATRSAKRPPELRQCSCALRGLLLCRSGPAPSPGLLDGKQILVSQGDPCFRLCQEEKEETTFPQAITAPPRLVCLNHWWGPGAQCRPLGKEARTSILEAEGPLDPRSPAHQMWGSAVLSIFHVAKGQQGQWLPLACTREPPERAVTSTPSGQLDLMEQNPAGSTKGEHNRH